MLRLEVLTLALALYVPLASSKILSIYAHDNMFKINNASIRKMLLALKKRHEEIRRRHADGEMTRASRHARMPINHRAPSQYLIDKSANEIVMYTRNPRLPPSVAEPVAIVRNRRGHQPVPINPITYRQRSEKKVLCGQ